MLGLARCVCGFVCSPVCQEYGADLVEVFGYVFMFQTRSMDNGVDCGLSTELDTTSSGEFVR